MCDDSDRNEDDGWEDIFTTTSNKPIGTLIYLPDDDGHVAQYEKTECGWVEV